MKTTFIILFMAIMSWSQHSIRNEKEAQELQSKAIKAMDDLNCAKTLEYSNQLLEYSLQNNKHSLSAVAYNLIALSYEEFSDLEKAISFYQKGIHYALLAKDELRLEFLYNNLGNLYYFRKENAQKGLEYYFKALKLSERSGDEFEIVFTKLNIVSSYFSIKQFDKGKIYLDQTKNYILKNNDFEMRITYYTLKADYASSKELNEEAETYFKTVLSILKEDHKDFYISHEVVVYDEVYSFYKKIGRNELALKYLEKHDSLQDVLYNKERAQEIQLAGSPIETLEANNKIQKIEAEKKNQEKKLKESNMINKITLVFSIVLAVLSIILAKSYFDYRRVNKKLKKSYDKIRIANKKVKEASRLKSQFLSNVSHELRTPMYGVIGMTDILESEHQELKSSKYFKSLKFSSKYLLALINDILNVYKIEDANYELSFEDIDIRKELKNIKETLGVIATTNNNKIEINVSESIPKFIQTDVTRFSQILINLMSNSLKFTKNGNVKVVLELEKIDGQEFIKIDVIDTGIGIPENFIEKIFDKFVQVDVRLEEQYKGTGLGLSIVKRLVELFDGNISLKSKINEGSTFTVILPHIKSEGRLNHNGYGLEENNFEEIVKSLNILIVEDNKINQMVTQKMLEKNKHICTIVNDGYSALEMTNEKSFDLILMDINMPGINGFETTKLIREKSIETPVIALTASDKHELLFDVKRYGMNDLLVKPFEIHDLQKLIDKYVLVDDQLIS